VAYQSDDGDVFPTSYDGRWVKAGRPFLGHDSWFRCRCFCILYQGMSIKDLMLSPRLVVGTSLVSAKFVFSVCLDS
jgi:hypothetical protein